MLSKYVPCTPCTEFHRTVGTGFTDKGIALHIPTKSQFNMLFVACMYALRLLHNHKGARNISECIHAGIHLHLYISKD